MARMARLVNDPAGKAFALALTDEVLRIGAPARAAQRLHDLVADTGVPSFPGPVDRLAIRLGAALAPQAPGLVMPLVAARLRREGGPVVLPAEERPLGRHIARRRQQGIRLNINVLGEAILGEDEAARRAGAVLAQLRRPDVDYVSVKISSLSSQVSALAFERTVEVVTRRLVPLYAEAAAARPAKFVNLDMEEYRDLGLTLEVFRRALEGFPRLDAGIVLQAYLPDSVPALEELCAWDAGRRAAGGGRIKVRIVKGANLAMERVDAELHGWEQAPFGTKAEVDANFLRLLDRAIAAGIDVGVASHNLFDVAWAVVLRQGRGAAGRVSLEMLEGMAEGQARAVREAAGDLLLYAPVAARHDVESSIAYLARRLDENTGPDNYLRHVFSLRPGSTDFDGERDRFLASVADRVGPPAPPRRGQDRTRPEPPVDAESAFANAPDTDFSLPANRRWVAAALDAFRPEDVPVIVAGRPVWGPAWGTGVDPSAGGRPIYRYTQASSDVVEEAVMVAWAGGRRWSALPAERRRSVLAGAAHAMAAGRGTAVAAMVRDTGKTIAEADTEVSEGIDFARYHAGPSAVDGLDGVDVGPVGTVVIAPPWNFPYSIPAGGVLAALAAGNAVILKPAPESVLTAWVLARQLWAGGVPPDVLQLVPCADDEVGRRLITHPGVGAVVLTGAWETAQLFRRWRPDLRLRAETSGKNAIVVTAAADLDAAVRDLMRSAFGNAGQKCSAASLAIVEARVLEEGAFLRRLADATRSLVVGPAADPATSVGPLIRPPGRDLRRALTTLDPGERWLVEPAMVGDDPYLWSPGVRTGVREGSWFHRTECFGPVLGVMAAADLDEAIRLQNGTDFGLTGGIQSLDRREVDRWLEGVEVGNAYVNRAITGAIVRRQPFGGWKRSSVGGGAKAGGPNQVIALLDIQPEGPEVQTETEVGGAPGVALAPDAAALHRRLGSGLGDGDRRLLDAGAASLARWQAEEFGVAHDPSGLRAEANLLRYRPRPGPVHIRAGAGASDGEVALAVLAAAVAGVAVEVSSPRPRPALAPAVAVAVEDAPALGRAASVRVLGEADPDLWRAAAESMLEIDDAPVVTNGRIELLRWYREQVVSITLHRYGSLIDRHSAAAPRTLREFP